MNAILHQVATAASNDRPKLSLPARTKAVKFYPGGGDFFCSVNSGLDADDALAEADSMLGYVRRQLQAALDADRATEKVEFDYGDLNVLVVILEMAGALRTAAGAVA